LVSRTDLIGENYVIAISRKLEGSSFHLAMGRKTALGFPLVGLLGLQNEPERNSVKAA
jgi:hypothetical protein